MAWCDGTDHISLESRICPVPLPLLSLATGLYGHKRMGSVGAEREPSPGCHCRAGPALLPQDIGTVLCSSGNTMAELIAQLRCSVLLAQPGLCPTARQLRAELCPVPDPKLSPSQGFAASWGVASGEFPSPCIACWESPPLPPGLVPSLRAWCSAPECSRASFPFRETLHGPCFWPACSTSPCWFSSIFFSPPLSLEAEIPRVPYVPAVALGKLHWAGWRGSPGVLLRVRLSVTVCASRQGEPAEW